MKQKDILLLSSLRANARETLTRISRKTKIPISTIFDRLRHHEENLIVKHTALIDFSRLGFSTRVTMTLNVHKPDREKVKDYLIKHQNINSVYKINNGYDFLIEAIFRNIKYLEDFIEDMEERFKIKSKQVYYIIEDIERENFMADPNLAEILCAEA